MTSDTYYDYDWCWKCKSYVHYSLFDYLLQTCDTCISDDLPVVVEPVEEESVVDVAPLYSIFRVAEGDLPALKKTINNYWGYEEAYNDVLNYPNMWKDLEDDLEQHPEFFEGEGL